jgi:hypothetical protein
MKYKKVVILDDEDIVDLLYKTKHIDAKHILLDDIKVVFGSQTVEVRWGVKNEEEKETS